MQRIDRTSCPLLSSITAEHYNDKLLNIMRIYSILLVINDCLSSLNIMN